LILVSQNLKHNQLLLNKNSHRFLLTTNCVKEPHWLYVNTPLFRFVKQNASPSFRSVSFPVLRSLLRLSMTESSTDFTSDGTETGSFRWTWPDLLSVSSTSERFGFN